MVGLAALYWPVALGRGIQATDEDALVGAATLGVSDEYIGETLGMSPEAYASRFGVNLYHDVQEMIDRERIDTVVLITRHTEHAEWAERMAALGVDIFIPKTFATTMSDADRIVEAGERHGVTIAVGPSGRFLPEMMAVKSAVGNDEIGEPFALRICHHHGTIDGFHENDCIGSRPKAGQNCRWGGTGST
jgi:predicted dehydrogenase